MRVIRGFWACWVLVWLVASAPGAVSGAENGDDGDVWPQWRGPSRDGSFAGESWPRDLGTIQKKWSVALGSGYSGPLVAKDRVFVTESAEGKKEMVRALDRSTGRELWRAEWQGAVEVPFFARRTGNWIKSTPSYDGESLFVCGMEGVLASLDAETGQVNWKADLPQRYGTSPPDFGFVTSPLVIGNALYIQGGRSFLKLDKRTGQEIWRTLVEPPGGMMGSAFSSPLMATIQGRGQLVVQTRRALAGVDPDSGLVLWRHELPSFRGMHILTPTVLDDTVFTSVYRNHSHLLDIGWQEESFTTTQRWQSKAKAYMSSPVVVGRHAYLHLQSKSLACIDLDSGEEKWRTSERFGEYWSLAVQGDRILALDSEGELILFRADPERFQLIDRRSLENEQAWGYLAVVNGQLFVRSLNAISAYDWK